MELIKTGSDTLFILLGAIMVLAMHAGFAFLELGTVRKKNQVNALVKIISDFAISAPSKINNVSLPVFINSICYSLYYMQLIVQFKFKALSPLAVVNYLTD